MEAHWLPTVLNMLKDVLPQCAMVKDLVRDDLLGQVLKGLPSLHLAI